MSFHDLKTERLLLRKLEETDVDRIFALRTDEKVNALIGRTPPRSIEDAAAFIQKMNTGIEEDNLFYWGITQESRPGLIGTICIFNFSEVNKTAEIGFEMLPDFRGKGLMQEAVMAVIDFCFGETIIDTMLAFTHPDNIASIKLLEKSSFKFESDLKAEEDESIKGYRLMKKGSNAG